METVPDIVDPGRDVIRVGDHFYVLALSGRADDRTRVLKHGDTFTVMDRYGDMLADRLGDQGLFHQGTRHVSRLDLLVGGLRPLLLSSGLDRENLTLAVDLTNPDLSADGHIDVPRGSVHIKRTCVLWDGVMHQRLTLHNYGLKGMRLRLDVRVAADFADVFEVRGVPRRLPGCVFGSRTEGGAIVAEYLGADRVRRWTRTRCEPEPAQLTPDGAQFDLTLEAGEESTLDIDVWCGEESRGTFDEALSAARQRCGVLAAEACEISTSSPSLNQWLERSLADLRLMISGTPWGEYPYAGVPWFSTPFGRDGAITALQTIWADPRLTRGVLGFMAATQADVEDEGVDAQPGKIFHEFRQGEMAATGQVPYGKYYGSVDSTPLFLMLAGEYLRRTGDLETIRGIQGNLRRALAWIDSNANADGFVTYSSGAPRGLTNKGWKDSLDSVFHEDGTLASGPIALCEVQGYAYAARLAAAEIARALGDPATAAVLERDAAALRERFFARFWDEPMGMYALALDGSGRPCRVAASNPGHCLFAGIARDDHAQRIADHLLSPRFFSGWGIRTVASDQSRYNPMSYHNGTIWPHDTAICAAGLSRYGRPEGAAKVLSAMLDAADYAESYRLPELFCGFPRRPGEGPIRYPVACAPQAWAAGAVFLLIQACLGLTIDPHRKEVLLHNPTLPEFVHDVSLRNLCVGGGKVDLTVQRRGGDLGLSVMRREGGVRVVLTH
jgi:glycogen debranching enzyme